MYSLSEGILLPANAPLFIMVSTMEGRRAPCSARGVFVAVMGNDGLIIVYNSFLRTKRLYCLYHVNALISQLNLPGGGISTPESWSK